MQGVKILCGRGDLRALWFNVSEKEGQSVFITVGHRPKSAHISVVAGQTATRSDIVNTSSNTVVKLYSSTDKAAVSIFCLTGRQQNVHRVAVVD